MTSATIYARLSPFSNTGQSGCIGYNRRIHFKERRAGIMHPILNRYVPIFGTYPHTYFAGANTSQGFVSAYPRFVREEESYRVFYIKGGSGTGKSTHTALWLKNFAPRASIINDDKPAIRIQKDGIFVYGTPWSGKTDQNKNVKVPLQGIAFLERGEENSITPCGGTLA